MLQHFQQRINKLRALTKHDSILRSSMARTRTAYMCLAGHQGAQFCAGASIARGCIVGQSTSIGKAHNPRCSSVVFHVNLFLHPLRASPLLHPLNPHPTDSVDSNASTIRAQAMRSASGGTEPACWRPWMALEGTPAPAAKKAAAWKFGD